jgi:hypothetical protein
MQAVAKIPPERPSSFSILLSAVSWQTYECFLKALDEESKIRLTYDRGYVEIIMSPLLPSTVLVSLREPFYVNFASG